MLLTRVLIASAVLSGLTLASPSTAPAQSTVVAGWDFSQYVFDGPPTIDGATLATTLPANYSDFDPTFGAGSESAAFGTMFLDGSNGSTAISQQNLPILASAVPGTGSLASNISGPINGVPSGDVAFDSGTVLQDEGQLAFERRALVAVDPVEVVFQADLSTLPSQPGGDWTLVFAGKTSSGMADVGIGFGAGAPSYVDVGSRMLDVTDQTFSVPLGSSFDPTVFVRLSLDGNTDTFIDNLIIQVPEPGAMAAAWSAIGALGLCHGLRRRVSHA